MYPAEDPSQSNGGSRPAPSPIVGLGAYCDLRPASADGLSQSFSVSEFALLADGRRVTLHNERGLTIGWGGGYTGDLAGTETTETLTQQVLNVVLPDEDDGQAHPWSWLAALGRARGLEVTANDLRVLPYEVHLSESVLRWLDRSRAKPGGSGQST